MTAKEYLMQIQRMKQTADSLGEKAEALRAEMEGLKAITYDKDRVQVSPSNRMEELMPKLIELEERYGEMIFKYHKAVLIRTEQIASLGNSLAKVLMLRYVEGKRWERIAVDLGYTYRNVTRIHKKALAVFEKRYKDVLECPM